MRDDFDNPISNNENFSNLFFELILKVVITYLIDI